MNSSTPDTPDTQTKDPKTRSLCAHASCLKHDVSARLDFGDCHSAATKVQTAFRNYITKQNYKVTVSLIVKMQSVGRMYLQRSKFTKLRKSCIVAQKMQRGRVARKLRSIMMRTIVASMSCDLLKFEKSRESEKQIVGRAKVIFEERCNIRVLILYMEYDNSSDVPSRVQIALFDGSSCSYSNKRNCVRFDVRWYPSLETHGRVVDIISSFNGACRLYVDFGSISKNQQFCSDYLNHYRLPLVVLSLASKTLRDVQARCRRDDLVKAYHSLRKALDNGDHFRECSMLPKKEKLEEGASRLSDGSAVCSDYERLSRLNESTLFVLFVLSLVLTPSILQIRSVSHQVT
jgi:hypothetical protein